MALVAAAASANSLVLDSTSRYVVTSWTSKPRTREALAAAEALHRAWERWSGTPHRGPRHRLRLFGSRESMRRALPGLGWAEAIYHDSLCDQYDDPGATRPWQWLLHEATHQLAHEDARLDLPRWANEGLACLFGTARIQSGLLRVGTVEPETYPVWWLRRKPLGGNLRTDLAAGHLVSPLQVLAESDTVAIGNSVNAHYLSWWSMAHYFHATDSVQWRDWVLRDGTKEGILRRFGPAKTLESRWYAHVLRLRDSAAAR